jgi:hypothetical protein
MGVVSRPATPFHCVPPALVVGVPDAKERHLMAAQTQPKYPAPTAFSHSSLSPYFPSDRMADSGTSANPLQSESSVAGLLGSRSISRKKPHLGLRA